MRIPSFEREKQKPFVVENLKPKYCPVRAFVGGNFRQLACGQRMPFSGYAILQL
jgi:hypothetical protein